MARDGVVDQDQKDLLKLTYHPVRSIKGAREYFFDVAATPPGQEDDGSISALQISN